MARKRNLPTTLAPAALDDLQKLIEWTQERFGKAATRRYQALIKQAIRDITAEPKRLGSMERPEAMIPGARTYHLALSRANVSGPAVKDPRHFLLYRQGVNGIEIARILNDARDLERNVPAQYRPPA